MECGPADSDDAVYTEWHIQNTVSFCCDFLLKLFANMPSSYSEDGGRLIWVYTCYASESFTNTSDFAARYHEHK